jgi:hypothetical protein
MPHPTEWFLDIMLSGKVHINVSVVYVYTVHIRILPLVGGTSEENKEFQNGRMNLLALRLQVLLITLNTALSLIYTIYRSSVHMH